MTERWLHNARLSAGVVTLLALGVLYVVWLAVRAHTELFVTGGKLVVAAVAVATGGVLAAYMLGYFWTDIAPRLYARLAAWGTRVAAAWGDEA